MSLTFSGITISGGWDIQPAFVPDAPTIGTATATGATTSTVAFTAPSYGGSTTITSYTATSNPGNITGTLSQAGSGTVTVTGLTANTSYTFTVTATNDNGTSLASVASNSITTYSGPVNTVAPVVSGTATNGQTLSTTDGTWTGTAPITYTYQWQRAGTNISLATNSTYTLVTADVGSAIRCVVTATNSVSAVSANSNATSSVAAKAPNAPTIGTATVTGTTTATVSFTAPADNGGATITSYTATSSPGNITGTLNQAESGTINMTGLTAGTSYTFTVTATNSAGTSSSSSASNSITTYAPPVNTVAPVVSGTASFGSTLSTTNGTWTGTAPITYTYQWQRAGVDISTATSSTYTLVAADVGNAIRCVVTGTNSYGNSSANSNSTSNVVATVPDAPTIGTATVVSGTSATVSFTAPTNNGGATITTYTATSSPGNVTGTLSQAGSGTITVNGLTSGTNYTFTVTATNSVGTSAASSASNQITTVTVPGAPTIGTATATGSTTATVSFTAPVNDGGSTITSYTATSSPGGITGTLNQAGSGTITVTGLSASTSYTFTVTATSIAGTGPASASSNSITTPLSGNIWSWGTNQFGQLGIGNTNGVSNPTQNVANASDWSQVSSGTGSTGGVKTDGTLWMWGRNNYGQLGDDTRTQRTSPVQTVAGTTNWRQVATGGGGAGGIKTDGTLWLWGRNNFGQLGDTTLNNVSSPIQTVAGGTNWSQVSLGLNQSSAIKSDGTLWMWGRNNYGQLGNNTRVDVSSPIQTVAGGANWKQVSNSSAGTIMAVKTDGTLWGWGINNSGGLGNNNTSQISSPVQTVAGGTNWLQVSAGYYFSAAIKTDNTLWTWGRNNYGQLGDGTRIDKSSPIQTVAGTTTWTQVSAGRDMTAGIKTDSTLWTWGRNNYFTGGALGDGTISNKSSPVQTTQSGLTWKQVSAGNGSLQLGAFRMSGIAV